MRRDEPYSPMGDHWMYGAVPLAVLHLFLIAVL